MQAESENIKVAVRIRPLNSREFNEKAENCVSIDPNNPKRLVLETKPMRTFEFDWIGDEKTSQQQIFESLGKSMVEKCLEGFNCCIFAYGQTGAGKTYTMQGRLENNGENHEDIGLQPRVLEYLFSLMKKEAEQGDVEIQFTISVTYLEIYNEQIMDLLSPDRTNLQVREMNKEIFVVGLKEVQVINLEDATDLLRKGAINRHISSTTMNKESSRSHSLFTLNIERKAISNDRLNVRTCKFHFVDLAGSERQKKTNSIGDRLKEAGNINKSLSVLGQVINSLVEISQGKKLYVRYRDSKLTYILKDSLGGNSKTSLIANISPASISSGETLSTLFFAQSAKQIKNKALVNEDILGTVEGLQNEIKQLKEELFRATKEERMEQMRKEDENMQFKLEYDEKVRQLVLEIEELKKNESETKRLAEIESKKHNNLLQELQIAKNREEENYEKKLREMSQNLQSHLAENNNTKTNELVRRNSELEEQVRVYKEQNQVLSQSIQEEKERSQRNLFQEKNRTTREIETLKASLNSLQQMNSNGVNEIARLNNMLRVSEDKVRILQEKEQSEIRLKEENKKMVKEVNNLKSTITNLQNQQNDVSLINQDLLKAREKIKILEESVKNFEIEKKLLLEEEKQITNDEDDLVHRVSNKQKDLGVCTEKIDAVITKILGSNANDENLEEEFDLEETLAELQRLEDIFIERQEEVNDGSFLPFVRRNQKTVTENQNRGKDPRPRVAKQESKERKNNNNEENSRLRSYYNGKINNLEGEFEKERKSDMNIRDSSIQIFGYQRKICRAYQQQLEELTKELNCVRSQDSAKIKKLQAKVNILQKELDAKTLQIPENNKFYEQQCKEFELQLQNMKLELNSKNEKLNKCEKGKKKLEDKKKELQKKYDKCKNTLDNLDKEADELESENDRLREERNAVKDKLYKTEEELMQQTKDQTKITEESNQIKAEKTELQENYEKLQMELSVNGNDNKKVHQLEAENEAKNAKLTELVETSAKMSSFINTALKQFSSMTSSIEQDWDQINQSFLPLFAAKINEKSCLVTNKENLAPTVNSKTTKNSAKRSLVEMIGNSPSEKTMERRFGFGLNVLNESLSKDNNMKSVTEDPKDSIVKKLKI